MRNAAPTGSRPTSASSRRLRVVTLVDRLADGGHVRFVEAAVAAGAAVAGGAESHALPGVLRVGSYCEVVGYQSGYVNESFAGGRLACAWVEGHAVLLVGSTSFRPFVSVA